MIKGNFFYQKLKTKLNKMFSLVFVIYICFYAVAFLGTWIKEKEPSVRRISNQYFNNITFKQSYIDLFGMTQNILGKKQIEKFTIYKNGYGKLVSPRTELTKQDVEQKVEEMLPIFELLTDSGEATPRYLYLTSLLPIPDEAAIPIGVTDATVENAEKLVPALNERVINFLDLRNAAEVKMIPEEKLFYTTDHHWSNEACFATYQAIMAYLAENTDFAEELPYYTVGDFTEVRKENSFLGSYGVKVGEYYAGKDDFVFLKPNFQTDFEFYAYDKNGELIQSKSGDWYGSLMDQSILDDPEYNNKYYAFLNLSSIESRIINKNAGNDLKLLLISHSYGRPLTQYLALNFAEVRNIDPQEGRFQGNYIEYIEEYDPDFVIFLTEFEGEIIGNYETSDE